MMIRLFGRLLPKDHISFIEEPVVEELLLDWLDPFLTV